MGREGRGGKEGEERGGKGREGKTGREGTPIFYCTPVPVFFLEIPVCLGHWIT